jgi:hypothetical protein
MRGGQRPATTRHVSELLRRSPHAALVSTVTVAS